jgi:hypothetical protein
LEELFDVVIGHTFIGYFIGDDELGIVDGSVFDILFVEMHKKTFS